MTNGHKSWIDFFAASADPPKWGRSSTKRVILSAIPKREVSRRRKPGRARQPATLLFRHSAPGGLAARPSGRPESLRQPESQPGHHRFRRASLRSELRSERSTAKAFERYASRACGCSSRVELQPSKLAIRVRFPSPALSRSRPADSVRPGAAGLPEPPDAVERTSLSGAVLKHCLLRRSTLNSAPSAREAIRVLRASYRQAW